MEDLTKSGIYIIFNMATNKFYVGSAICIKRRWKDHKTTLNKGIHKNQQLQRAWLKYGSCAFTFSVIEVIENQEDLIIKEQYWLDKLQACEKGYNTNPTASSCLGRKHTEETRKKMRESAFQRKNEKVNSIKGGDVGFQLKMKLWNFTKKNNPKLMH